MSTLELWSTQMISLAHMPLGRLFLQYFSVYLFIAAFLPQLIRFGPQGSIMELLVCSSSSRQLAESCHGLKMGVEMLLFNEFASTAWCRKATGQSTNAVCDSTQLGPACIIPKVDPKNREELHRICKWRRIWSGVTREELVEKGLNVLQQTLEALREQLLKLEYSMEGIGYTGFYFQSRDTRYIFPTFIYLFPLHNDALLCDGLWFANFKISSFICMLQITFNLSISKD